MAVDDSKISFQIEVRGLHKRAVIRTESFSRREKEKSR